MAVVSCANLQAGWFTAYRHLAGRTDLDVVVHLGDYLYEYEPGEYQARDVVVRPHDPPHEMVTLADYRRGMPSTSATPTCRRCTPRRRGWSPGTTTSRPTTPGPAARRTTPRGAEGAWSSAARAASQQAYAEWMPVRYEPGGHLYRRLSFGSLASLSMLDLRTYRDQQAPSMVDPAVSDPPHDRRPEQLSSCSTGSPTTPSVEAGRQPGDDRAGALPEHAGHVEPDRPGDPARRGDLPGDGRRTTSTSGTAIRRPRGLRPPARPRGPRRGLPDRRHPLRLGRRAAGRRADLPGDRRQRRGGAGLHLGDQRQPGRHLGTAAAAASWPWRRRSWRTTRT